MTHATLFYNFQFGVVPIAHITKFFPLQVFITIANHNLKPNPHPTEPNDILA